MRISRMRLLALVQSRGGFHVYFELNAIMTSPIQRLKHLNLQYCGIYLRGELGKPGFSWHHSSC
jgi:hypothetical protein